MESSLKARSKEVDLAWRQGRSLGLCESVESISMGLSLVLG